MKARRDATSVEAGARSLTGLTQADAAHRLEELGPNAIPESAPTPLWRRLVRQLRGPLTLILLFAHVFDLGAWLYEGGRGWPIEAMAIAAVLVLNAALGVIQEYRSENALARLKTLGAPVAWALRDGRLVHIPSSQLVPGDVIRVEAGERIPADGTLLDGLGVMIDESVLTGESVRPWSASRACSIPASTRSASTGGSSAAAGRAQANLRVASASSSSAEARRAR